MSLETDFPFHLSKRDINFRKNVNSNVADTFLGIIYGLAWIVIGA